MCEIKIQYDLKNILIVGYPEGARADAIEKQIAATLPELSGLSDELSGESRIKLMDESIVTLRAAFIQMHGDPFGNELVHHKQDNLKLQKNNSVASIELHIS